MLNLPVGLGNDNANIIFYIRNRPPLKTYQNLNSIKPLIPGEISHICQETGNHWRKIFNVYAKLLFELSADKFSSWQQLRDEQLLQAHSQHCLLFSAPNLTTNYTTDITYYQTTNSNSQATYIADLKKEKPNTKLHIVLGKGYAQELSLANESTWLSDDFAINAEFGLIICPYFDYRQLSNIKIIQLAGLIKQLLLPETSAI
jgi:arsenate reductase-like glutaredoxin family protein